jgi:hypothetical protein
VQSGPPAPADFASVRPARFPAKAAPIPIPPVGPYAREPKPFQIQVLPPGKERVSRVENDRDLEERIRQETLERDVHDLVVFPEKPLLSRDTYAGRGTLWDPRTAIAEPHFVGYQKLLFEDKNAERYGWDLGIVSPIVCAAEFYADLALVPYHLAMGPCRKYEFSSGYCMPGDPVPFLLYPPEISLTGTAAEVAVIAALIAIFP